MPQSTGAVAVTLNVNVAPAPSRSPLIDRTPRRSRRLPFSPALSDARLASRLRGTTTVAELTETPIDEWFARYRRNDVA